MLLREFVRLDWERRRGVLLLTSAVFALVPVIALVLLGSAGRRRPESVTGLLLAQNASVLLMGGIALGALAWGAGAWADERRGNWIYALSLPLSRVQLFALRYLAGLVWLAVPLALLGVSVAAVSGAAVLPAGVYAYPGAFFRWSALVSWLLYTLMFVVSARFERPWTSLAIVVIAVMMSSILLNFGVFPLLSGFVEALVFGDASPIRPIADAQPLFSY
jgi:ABC-type transport system involved in multi-copper enzyme maturation permease subunit